MTKDVRIQVGVADNLQEMALKVPKNDPRPWDGNDQLKYIGGRTTRLDGVAKVTGAAKYTFDMRLPGMLYGKFARSPYPAAVVKSIDYSKALKAPGVKAVLPMQEKLPFSVRFVGQEVAGVAAKTLNQAEEAAKLIEIEYEVKNFTVKLDDAMKENAPLVWDVQVKEEASAGDIPGQENTLPQVGNIRGPNVSARNATKEEIDSLVNASYVTSEGVYRTQVQTHSAMETHGVVAKWDDDKHLTVWASTQSTFRTRKDFAERFELPEANVRVITEHMGGGFGAKFGADTFGVMAAKLSKVTQAPVFFMLDRKEEHWAGGNRPSSLQNVRLGANKEGKLEAIKMLCHGSAGIGTGSGTGNPFKNLYPCEKLYVEESDVFTNAGMGRAFRAPGHPQGIFALEQGMDDLAYQLGLDPLEIRRRNTSHEVRLKEYEIGAKKFGWSQRNPKVAADSGPIKRGVGMANSVWYYFYGTGFPATIQVNSDGSVEIMNGVQDIGTGIRTVLAMIVAEELGLDISEVKVKIGDSDLGAGPASGGSQTTGGITPAVRKAAYLAKQKMREVAAPLFGVSPEQIGFENGRAHVLGDPSTSLGWQQVASRIPGGQFKVVAERKKDYFGNQFQIICGVQFAEVEVDTQTGVVKVKRVVAVHDCGRPMNRLTLESQINGGIIQGVSYALFENRLLDRNTGHMVNPNLEQYKIAGSMDIPEIDSTVIDVFKGHNSTSAMGIGEPATVPTAGAIANAIYHATGARIYDLPMTPDKILAALA